MFTSSALSQTKHYQDVTFSDAIVDSIEEKVAPAVRTQTESTVVDFVSDYFSAKKVNRKPRKPRAPRKEEGTKETPTVSEPTLESPATETTAPAI